MTKCFAIAGVVLVGIAILVIGFGFGFHAQPDRNEPREDPRRSEPKYPQPLLPRPSVVLTVLWEPYSPACRKEIEGQRSLYSKFAPSRRFTMFSYSVTDEYNNFAKAYDLPWETHVAEEGSIFYAYEINAVPTYLLIRRNTVPGNDNEIGRWEGPGHLREIEAAILAELERID